MKVNMERLRRLEQLREIKRLSPHVAVDEQKKLLQCYLDRPGMTLAALIRELSAAYRRASFTAERKNAALALITVCRERNLLDQLALCWTSDGQRQLKRAHWFALALLEGCQTNFAGSDQLQPWFFPLARLITRLATYARRGFICDPQAGATVRQNARFAQVLVQRCRRLIRALTQHLVSMTTIGGLTGTITHLEQTIRDVDEVLAPASNRPPRTHAAELVLETRRLAQEVQAYPVFTTHRASGSSLPS